MGAPARRRYQQPRSAQSHQLHQRLSLRNQVTFLPRTPSSTCISCPSPWPPALAAIDLTIVVRHIHQGAHYQPGKDVPPY
ncbi:DUF6343 family protein, partial [Streptomyces rimosus]|uniref:DUF6343 family protein n=1 Tax=Streptomyces rimosus TaxID=1927 RepID=UPI001F25B9E8